MAAVETDLTPVKGTAFLILTNFYLLLSANPRHLVTPATVQIPGKKLSAYV